MILPYRHDVEPDQYGTRHLLAWFEYLEKHDLIPDLSDSPIFVITQLGKIDRVETVRAAHRIMLSCRTNPWRENAYPFTGAMDLAYGTNRPLLVHLANRIDPGSGLASEHSSLIASTAMIYIDRLIATQDHSPLLHPGKRRGKEFSFDFRTMWERTTYLRLGTYRGLHPDLPVGQRLHVEVADEAWRRARGLPPLERPSDPPPPRKGSPDPEARPKRSRRLFRTEAGKGTVRKLGTRRTNAWIRLKDGSTYEELIRRGINPLDLDTFINLGHLEYR